jgi:hypothetical protein
MDEKRMASARDRRINSHSQETATQRARVIARAANSGRVKRKHKKHVARTPVAVEKYKQLFLAQLEKGRSPGVAARNIKIARCTTYGWRKADQEFDAAWKDAVETGLDVLETSVYDSALAGNSSDAQFILKHRRRAMYGNTDCPKASNFILNITLQKHYKRLGRLGLPIPMIESDLEEDDAPPQSANHP